jgi:hypothetical protein
MLITKSYKAVNIFFEDNKLIVNLEDGREVAVPLEWFPRLRNATREQLENWRLIGNGEGIYWEEIDEDVLVENLLN